LELDVDDVVRQTSPICAIFDGLYRFFDYAVQLQDEDIKKVPFLMEILPEIMNSIVLETTEEERIHRVVRCVGNKWMELCSDEGTESIEFE
jgi:hypothetical protein